MLWKRLLLGPALILALLGLAWLDAALSVLAAPAWWPAAMVTDGGLVTPGLVTATVLLGLSVVSSREHARLVRASGVEAPTGLTTLSGALGLLVIATTPPRGDPASGMAAAATAAGLVVVAAVVHAGSRRRVGGLTAAAGSALLAFCLWGLLLGSYILLRREHSVWVLVWVLLATKACDIGAYFVGRAIGRRRMVPWLSPGKTWEGFAGGIASAALVGGGGAALLGAVGVGDAPWPLAGAVVGGVFAVLGQAGDLLISVLKREGRRKDSGGSLPGFGGVLDVLDSLLLVGPAAYWLV